MIRTFATVVAALLGLAFGSFLNVCLSRWPAGESIVRPRSHCRHCGRPLAWWENIPLASWIALGGRCRTCHASIGVRYALVEAAVGVLWALAAFQSLPSAWNPAVPLIFLWIQCAVAALQMILLWLLVALAVLDAEHLWLPNWITFPGILLGLATGFAKLPILRALSSSTGLPLTEGIENTRFGLFTPAIDLIFGVIAAAGLILAIRWTYWLLRRQEGIGLGDAKLMAMLAAWLGLPGALLAFAIGVMLGAVAAVFVLASPARPARIRSQVKLPLGTFLSIGGIVSSLWGRQIVAAYLRWSGLG